MNLLFLYTDEQRADTMAAYGNRLISTPNMDKLANDGVVFERGLCTQTVCTPSRSSILTGLYPHSNGCYTNNVPLPADVPCLTEMLPSGKFATGHVGKWHLGDELFAQHGFEEWVGTEDGYHLYYTPGRDPGTFSDYGKFLVEQGFPPVTTRSVVARHAEPFTKAHFVGTKASDFIQRHKAEPFVLYVNFLEPHMPFYGPRNDQYDPAAVPPPENFDAFPGPEQHLKHQLYARAWARYGFGRLQNIESELATAPEVEFPLETEAQWRRIIANYWGLTSMVDAALGRILATLEECGLDDETAIVFTSDHGDMMGSHRMISKMTQYEEAARVPYILRLPGRAKAGARVRQPVSQVDLVPTLLELLGAAPPPELQGQSLLPHLLRGEPLRFDHPVVEWNGSDSGFGNYDKSAEGVFPDRVMEGVDGPTEKAAAADPIRTVYSPDGWKLSVSPGGFGHELYHLETDPGERRNRIGDPEGRRVADRLLPKLREWQERTGDEVALPGELKGRRPGKRPTAE